MDFAGKFAGKSDILTQIPWIFAGKIFAGKMRVFLDNEHLFPAKTYHQNKCICLKFENLGNFAGKKLVFSRSFAGNKDIYLKLFVKFGKS